MAKKRHRKRPRNEGGKAGNHFVSLRGMAKCGN